VVHKNKIVC